MTRMHSVSNIEMRKITRSSSHSSKSWEIGHFPLISKGRPRIVQYSAVYNTSVDSVFNSLSVLFGDVLIIVIIVFCVSSPFAPGINRGPDEMKINN